MPRVDFCVGIGLAAFLCLSRGLQGAPNLIVILVDDLRYDTFGHMGHPFVETPHIDALASGGLRFTHAFVTTSLCSPARASFLTGQYMHHHGVVDNQRAMPKGLTLFPALLQKAGYRTAFIGKWHMGGTASSPRPGFDHWVSFAGQGTYLPDGHHLNVDGREIARYAYMTDELTDYATRWIGRQTQGQPFMLYLSHKGVHGLYEPAPRHRDRYRDVAFELPASVARTDDNHGVKPMWVHDQRNSWHGVEFPYHGRSRQSVGEMYRHYCEMILSIDDSVGRILDALDDAGLTRDTVLLFTSDGGHLWGEHGLIDKRCAYEESIRIPFLLYGPSTIPAGTACDALVANIDVAPTVLQLCGIDSPAGMDGRSLVPLIEKPSQTDNWRAALLYEYFWEAMFPQTPTTFALRNRRYKYIQYHGIWDSDELYDMVDDPHEMVNLLRDPQQAKRVEQMRQQLDLQLQADGGVAIPVTAKRRTSAALRRGDRSRRAPFPDDILVSEPVLP